MSSPSNRLKYLIMTIASFLTFGFLSIYWSLLKHVESDTILLHRSLWTFLTLIPCVIYNKNYKTVLSSLRASWKYFIISSLFIATNWLTFIYAVNNDYVFEASLAYFISPLITILLSFFFLKESINGRQGFAILLALLSIAYLLIAKGIFPKYALLIGCSFSLYGLLGRKIQAATDVRLIVESFFVSVCLLFFLQSPQGLLMHFQEATISTRLFLVFSGLVTIVPMSLFIIAAKNVKFTTVGVLSFILPSMVFLVGIFYFHETIDREKLISIILIWIGVGLYIFDLLFPKKTISRDAEIEQ